MKEKNYLFLDIISVLFLAILFFCNFLALMYTTTGSIPISAIIGLILTICYYYVVELLKRNKDEMVKHKYKHSSSVFFLFFSFLAVISFYLMSHFINVEYNCKEDIQKDIDFKLSQLDALVLDYENKSQVDLQNYGARFESLLSRYRNKKDAFARDSLLAKPFSIGADDLNSSMAIEKVKDIYASSIQKNINSNLINLDSIKNEISLKKEVFLNWKRMSLVPEYENLNSYLKLSQGKIEQYLLQLPFNKSTSNISFADDKLPLNSPSELSAKYPPNRVLPFFVILIIHLLILIPFFLKPAMTYAKKSSETGIKDGYVLY